jgi:heme A synthase
MLIEDGLSPGFRQLCAATAAAVFVQLALGAALRHQALDLVPHLAWAAVVSVLGGWVVIRTMRQLSEQKPLQRLAMTLGILLIVQLSLGGLSYLTRSRPALDPAMIWSTTAHVAVGAAVLGTSWVLTLLAFRRVAPPRAMASLRQSPQKSPA